MSVELYGVIVNRNKLKFILPTIKYQMQNKANSLSLDHHKSNHILSAFSPNSLFVSLKPATAQ